MKKYLCLCLTLLLLAGCGVTEEPVETAPVELTGSLTLQYLEGGTLLQCNGETALIGGGVSPQALRELGVETLSCVILTDAGDSEELPALLAEFPAPVICPGELPGTETVAPEDSLTLWLDCAELRLLVPEEAADGMAVEAVLGECRFWFLGAMPVELQQKLVSRPDPERPVEVLRLADPSAVSEELLTAAGPTYVAVEGRAEPLVQQGWEVLEITGYDQVMAETDGIDVVYSMSMHVSDSIASDPMHS